MTPPKTEYRILPLTQGQIAYVSPQRFDDVNRFKWCASWTKLGRCFYASRSVEHLGGKNETILLHRYILGLGLGDLRTADHKNKRRTLDNTEGPDGNLRIASREEQAHNKGKYKNNTSGYKGVSFNKENGKWRAIISVGGKRIHLGYFGTPEEAYMAYCVAAYTLHGDFACVE